jgi:hypothetical protein
VPTNQKHLNANLNFPLLLLLLLLLLQGSAMRVSAVRTASPALLKGSPLQARGVGRHHRASAAVITTQFVMVLQASNESLAPGCSTQAPASV